MPVGRKREKILQGLAKGRGIHRYTLWRWGVGVLFTALIAALPLFGVLRFDFWGGRHLVLGEELGLVEAAKAFAFPFLLVNVGIVIATRLAGRYLCGFVCPVGALARFAEWSRRKRTSKLRAGIETGGLFSFCLLLALITLAFWVDLAVFVDGSPLAVGLSATFVLGTALILFIGSRAVGLRFCRDWCPSGVYFAVLGPESRTGIEFAHPGACTDCNACDTVCPIDLEPRSIIEPRNDEPIHNHARGFYPEGMSSLSLCIRCGDCVTTCEGINEDRDVLVPLRMGLTPPRAEAPGDDD